MAKLWAGRTDGATDKLADDFNSSIRFDHVMYRQDITGSMAHAAMLAAQSIIRKEEADALIDGLQGILDDLDSGALEFDLSCLFSAVSSSGSLRTTTLSSKEALRFTSILNSFIESLSKSMLPSE